MIDIQIAETLAVIAKRTNLRPKLAFVLGSGLSGFAKHVRIEAEVAFADLPHYAPAHVEGHPGKLSFGHIDGVAVAVQQGRLHAYEGLSPAEVIYPTRVLAALGVNTLVLTNAAGGLRDDLAPGDLMIIRDHINLTGINPLVGPNWSKGPRFVDMTEAYDKGLSDLLEESLTAETAPYFSGTYVGVMGPSYETAAEIRFFSSLGAGAVGMSTVFETIAARHAGVRVAGLSCITNLGTGLSPTKLDHAEVKETAQKVEDYFTRTLARFARLVAPSL